jgi:hypothetical protein
MITREKLQRGEGELVAENPLIGLIKRASFKEKMASDEGISQEDKDFRKTFHAMSEMVTVLYEDYLERKRPVLGNTSKGKSEEEEDHPHIPPSPPSTPPSSPSSSSSSSKSNEKKNVHKHKHEMPLLKLDVKFELPIYDGEVNAEKLDNWIRQMEVYCSVQQIKDEATQIKLASLRLAGTALIWWQSKLQKGTQDVGKVFPSWKNFISAPRKQFYPLGYKEKALIEWQSLKLRKGQSVQEYTDGFRKMALMLDIPLQTQETLMKYIGGLPAHIRNTVFMFGPTNLDEVSVQATYIEAGKAGMSGESSFSKKDDKRKRYGNGKNANTVSKKEEKPSCKHCKKEGHDEDKCWQLHPEKRPKWFKGKKGTQTVAATTSKPIDLGSDSGDESKMTLVGMTGKFGEETDCRNKLFHIRVIMRHTKIDTLIDSGSQSNLISEELVKKLGLITQTHHKPYTLQWMSNRHQMHITKQCTVKFAISDKYVDEVTCDVVSLKECGIVLGSPYLYDRKAIFYRTKNQYQFTKEGHDYIVHAHHVKESKKLQTMEQLTKAVQVSNKPLIVSSEVIDLKQEQDMIIEWKINHKLLQDKFMSCKYFKYISSFAVIFLMLSLAMFSTWMIVASVKCSRIAMTNNVLSVVIIALQLILMRQVHRTEFRDRGQAGWPIPSLLTGL